MNNIANPGEILHNIIEIRKYLQNNSQNETKIKFKDFENRYPSVYKKIVSGDDLSKMLDMLQTLAKIRNGDITKDDADKMYGNQLAKEYIPEHILKDKKPNNNNSNADT